MPISRRRLAPTTLALTLGLAGATLLPPTPPLAAGPPAQPVFANDRLGLVHVDLMDLHAVRLPDAPPVDRPELAAEDLAARCRLAADLGAGWHRWTAYWDLIERAGTDTWTVTDGMLARDRAHSLRSLVVLQGNQPGLRHQTGAPENLDQPIFLDAGGAGSDDPAVAAGINTANRWARFVAAVVDRYRPGGAFGRAQGWGPGLGVRHWQIGNEPNLPGFWRGTPADYARLLEVSALVAKWLDPEAVIVHAGIADDGNAEAWYGRFVDALVARAAVSPLPARYGFYFDKAAWHWYRSPSLLATGPDRARAILVEHGLPLKPLWVTELGVPVWSEHPGPCWDPNSPGRATIGEQAGFVWQALAEALVADVETVFYFQLYDDCGNGPDSYDAFGLVRNPAGHQCWVPAGQACWAPATGAAGSPRPAFQALQVAARELNGARPLAGAPGGPGWQSAVFQSPGARVTLAWSLRTGEQPVTLPAHSAAATLYALDSGGNLTQGRLSPSAGRYSLRLPGVTNHNGLAGRPILRGSPVMLVEAGAAATGLTEAGAAGAAAPGAVADTTPPVLALVRELPALSPPRFELGVVAGDEESGVAAFSLYAFRGPRPPRPGEWWPMFLEAPWAADPRAGVVSVPWEGRPGETWYFAAQAGDAAGNWTAPPTFVHTHTRLAAPSRATPALTTPAPRTRSAGRHIPY